MQAATRPLDWVIPAPVNPSASGTFRKGAFVESERLAELAVAA